MHPTSQRSLTRSLLSDRRGGFRDLFIALIIVSIAAVTASIAAPTTTTTTTTSTGSSAERLSAATALVDDRRASTQWGTADAPSSTTLDLPSGTNTTVLLWKDADPTGVIYNTLIPRSVRTPSQACTTAAAATNPQCVLVSSFRAYDLTSLVPSPILRMDPSQSTAVGTLDPGVAARTPLPTGTVIGTAQTPTDRAWRYLIHASSTRPAGELRLIQGGARLATIPLSSTPTNYFGTVAVSATTPVAMVVNDGPVTVDTVLVYDAGATE